MKRIVLILLTACSSSTTPTIPADQAQSQIVTSYCNALMVCCATDSGTEFCSVLAPDDATCIQNLGTDVQAGGHCTQDQLNTCISQIQEMTCEQLTDPNTSMPSSCNGC
jgi:hypothetical protein